jgi:cytochrome c2
MKSFPGVNFAFLLALGLLNIAGLNRMYEADSQVAEPKNGAELWEENCTMCHEGKPKISFTPEKLDAIRRHMQEKADLSPEEQEAVLKFLKSGN